MTEMLQKTENIAKNVANENSQDLTEQMKIGKLPEGYYYLKLNPDFEDRYCVAYNMGMDFDLYAKGFDIDEVLAPVPSYKEWKEKDDALTALLAEYGKLTKELQDEKEKHKTRPSLRSPADEMVIEKQVWESTLNRSMVLQAENETLKDALKDCQEKILLMDYDSIKIEILKKIDEVLNA